MTALGDRIRELRAGRGWSQEEFAYQCGLHRTYIGHMELGTKNISFESLVTIVGALGVTMAELFTGLEQRAKSTEGRSMASPVLKRGAAVGPGGRSGADVNRLITELRLQRTLMERALDALGRNGGKSHGGAKASPKRRR